MGWFSSNIMFSPKPSALAVASLFIIARGTVFNPKAAHIRQMFCEL